MKAVVCSKCVRFVNEWCEKVIDSPYPDVERDCQYFREKTNADRIRSMSDEELEESFRKIAIGYEPWCDHHCKMNGDDNCNSCLAKWLKQPAEDAK